MARNHEKTRTSHPVALWRETVPADIRFNRLSCAREEVAVARSGEVQGEHLPDFGSWPKKTRRQASGFRAAQAAPSVAAADSLFRATPAKRRPGFRRRRRHSPVRRHVRISRRSGPQPIWAPDVLIRAGLTSGFMPGTAPAAATSTLYGGIHGRRRPVRSQRRRLGFV